MWHDPRRRCSHFWAKNDEIFIIFEVSEFDVIYYGVDAFCTRLQQAIDKRQKHIEYYKSFQGQGYY